MKTITYQINDPEGIHARPAGMLVKEASKFSSKITISKDGREVDAKSIFGVMSLAVKKGQTITVAFDGADESEAENAVMSFLKDNM